MWTWLLIALPELAHEDLPAPARDRRDAMRLVRAEDQAVAFPRELGLMLPQAAVGLECLERAALKVAAGIGEHHVDGDEGSVVHVLHPRERSVPLDSMALYTSDVGGLPGPPNEHTPVRPLLGPAGGLDKLRADGR